MLMKMRSKMQRKDNQKGFTLVELMVVVVILGILVAIAVPIYNNVTSKAKINAHLANIRTLEGAVESYKAATDTFVLTDLDATSAAPGFLAGYIKEWPTKPGTYVVTDGVVIGNPTKATVTAANYVWP